MSRAVSRRLLLATPFLPLLAFLPGGGWALGLLSPLTLYPSFVPRVRAGNYAGAWRLGMLWALLLSVGVILLVFLFPETARAGIVEGERYRQEMFGWIATGEGKENDWHRFLPEHLLHLGAFVLLTWLSAGYLGLVLGAFLVAYMSYFVGSFAVASGHPMLGSIAAWVPWSVIRVGAFVLLGTVFARPLLVRRVWPFERLEVRLMAVGGAGILADLLIKTFFARPYGLFLRQMVRSAMEGLG
ncbi:MAG TPA: hypothetical protein VE078_10785 [Thermoanaerobaculia bacterium]|nr:hypothetical protein [Thermoanaerobaculia bacterium]